jgi:NAD(P)-dependent dehydrogenase (short-subunit alcohol dehydrogenase family)
MELTARVAIVTGGARGIGLAIVEDLLRHGAAVVVVDAGVTISGAAAEPGLAERVTHHLVEHAGAGGRAAAVSGDIGDPETARSAVALARERFGAVDIVVNNAAIVRDAFIFKPNHEAWDAVLRTNLTGAYNLLSAAAPLMRDQVKQGRAPGAIVNIVSSAGIYGNFGQAAYASAKAGLIGLTRVAAHDLARSGIACNAVAPFAATRVTESIQPANDAQAAYKAKALNVPPLYVARLVSWLASAAASHVSGQVFGVRGREVFVFSQARPAAKLLQPAGGYDLFAFAREAKALEPAYAELVTDLEAFAGDPVL